MVTTHTHQSLNLDKEVGRNVLGAFLFVFLAKVVPLADGAPIAADKECACCGGSCVGNAYTRTFQNLPQSEEKGNEGKGVSEQT